MTSSSASAAPARSSAAPARSRLAIRLASLTPLWVLIVSLASQGYFPPMITNPPEVLGIPLGVVITAIAIVWMLIGTGLVWDERRLPAEPLVPMLFKIPATVVVFFTPAVVLIIANLP